MECNRAILGTHRNQSTSLWNRGCLFHGLKPPKAKKMATVGTRRIFALGAFAGTLGAGYLLMKLTVPSKESLMEVRYDVD